MGNCTCQDQSTKGLCITCTLDQMARNHYFPGKWLDTRAFDSEQTYFMGKDRRHNRYLHGAGVVCGLRVRQHPNPACRNRLVIIEPGVAVDCCGREIYVADEETVEFKELFAAAWRAANGPQSQPDAAPHTFQLCLNYTECPTEEVPALFDDCRCDDTALQPNQILEGYEFAVRLDPVITPPEPPGIELDWANTLNVPRASQLAYNRDGERLYVLTADDPATLYTFPTDNYSFLPTNTLSAAAQARALSGDGTRLYVALATGNTVQVWDVDTADGRPGALVNELTHNETVTRLAVSPGDGRLYALTPATNELVVWSADINTAGADLTAAKLATIAVGNGAADVAVLPGGGKVVVANSADSNLSVIDPANLPAGATTAATDIAPTALAVAGTTAAPRLFVADAGSKSVQSTNGDTLAAIGGPQTLAQAPLAITASPGGRWLYVLVDAAGEGQLWVIDAHALEAGELSMGGNVAVGEAPQSLRLAAAAGLMYVAFAGDPAVDNSGGVALVDIRESDCERIFEAALDGCPACPDDACLVLATVTDYVFDSDVTDDTLDNLRDRPLLPSTSALYEAILCLLAREQTGSAGEQGPPGDPGQGVNAVDVTFVPCTEPGSATFDPATGALALEIPRGCDGNDGVDGQGITDVQVNFVPCDQPPAVSFVNGVLTLTLPSDCADPVKLGHICAINWNHAGPTPRAQVAQGLVVAFDREVRNGDINAHTFRVEVGLRDNQFGSTCWCQLPAKLVTGVKLLNPCSIKEGFEIIDPTLPDNPVTGAIYLPGVDFSPGFEYRVTLEGDHLRTPNPAGGGWGAALDANFLRGQLPTGDGVEGGRFFSWFRLGEAGVAPLDVNRATVTDLQTVRGIGPELARAIVNMRTERGGFGSVDELIDVSGIGPSLLAKLKPQLTASK
ncbi:MAG: hypothetical protein FOGNACKC_00021 [Anaerolineae bacterium]|nr:hypothetical protein [Anaerolineae bacterium]